jgi:hypothetical protein
MCGEKIDSRRKVDDDADVVQSLDRDVLSMAESVCPWASAGAAAKRAELLPKLHLLAYLFVQEEPGVNNRILRDVVTTIHVTPHTVTFDFR